MNSELSSYDVLNRYSLLEMVYWTFVATGNVYWDVKNKFLNIIITIVAQVSDVDHGPLVNISHVCHEFTPGKQAS